MTEKQRPFNLKMMRRYQINDEQYSNLRAAPGMYSPSKLKKLMRGNFIDKTTPAKALGRVVHRAIEARLKNETYLVRGPFVKEDGKDCRRGTTEHKSRLDEWCAEKKITEEQCSVQARKEFEDISKMLPLLENFVDKSIKGFPLDSLYIEDSIVIGKEALEKYSPVSKIFQGLKDVLFSIFTNGVLSDMKGVIGRPDLYGIEKDKSGIHVWDWKTTSKNDLPGVKSQIDGYDYYCSLFIYCIILEMVWQIPVKSINLVMAPKSNDAKGILVYANDIKKLKEKNIREMSYFFRDTVQTGRFIHYGEYFIL